MGVSPQARVECPACREEHGVSRAGRIVNHRGNMQWTKNGRWWCSGSGTQVAEPSVWTPDRSVDPLEAAAQEASYKGARAWKFIHQQDPPEEFERGLRSLIVLGADPVTIVGAISIAAMKRDLPYTDQWRYSIGVVRNELLRRKA